MRRSADGNSLSSQVLSPEEEQAHYNAVIKGGATWGGAGLLGGTLAASLLNQRSHVFRSLTVRRPTPLCPSALRSDRRS